MQPGAGPRAIGWRRYADGATPTRRPLEPGVGAKLVRRRAEQGAEAADQVEGRQPDLARHADDGPGGVAICLQDGPRPAQASKDGG